MAWNTYEPISTKHTCGGPVFGRKTKGCPRCDELIGGAAPKESWTKPSRYDGSVDRYIKHYCVVNGVDKCGNICTFGEW